MQQHSRRRVEPAQKPAAVPVAAIPAGVGHARRVAVQREEHIHHLFAAGVGRVVGESEPLIEDDVDVPQPRQHEGELQFGVEAAGVALVKLLGVGLGLGHGQTRCDGAERPANRVEGQQLKCATKVDGAADVLRFCVAFGQETFPVKLAVAGSGVDEPKVALGRTDGVVDSDGRDRVGIRRWTLQVADGQSTAEDGRCSGVGVHEGGLLGRVEGEGFIPPEGVCRYCIVLKSCVDVGAGHARPTAFRGMWMGEGRPEGVLPGVGQR